MKRIEICVGTDREKNIRVRLSLLRLDESGNIESERYHSMQIMPGDGLSLCRAAIEGHLNLQFSVNGIPGSPWPKIPDSEWAEVEQIAGILHTPERIAKRRQRDLENEARMNLVSASRQTKTTS